MLGAGSYFGKFTSMLGLPMGTLVILTTTHLVTGALMLATSLLLTLRAYRFSTTSKAVHRSKSFNGAVFRMSSNTDTVDHHRGERAAPARGFF